MQKFTKLARKRQSYLLWSDVIACLYHIQPSLIDFFCKSIDNLCDKVQRQKIIRRTFKKIRSINLAVSELKWVKIKFTLRLVTYALKILQHLQKSLSKHFCKLNFNNFLKQMTFTHLKSLKFFSQTFLMSFK